MNKYFLNIFFTCNIFVFTQIMVSCDKCKYTKSNPILLDYASITFSFYTITETYQIKDFFNENPSYYPDSLKLFDMNHNEVYLQRTPNKNEFTFYFVDNKIKKKIFDNLLIRYYYLLFNSSDIDTLQIEMKGQYTGNCDNEAFEVMRMYYNNSIVINKASKGQIYFGFTYNKKN
jgi:hypothetical protein